jgi:hypothetical protein
VSTVIDALLTRAIQIPGVRRLWTRFPVGSVPTRVRYDAWDRPHYAYGVYSAGDLARQLGLPGITAIEFGVAGGNGLIALEKISRAVGDHLGIEISVFGFDLGDGMPAPRDYRDLPYVWDRGFYRMDRVALEARLDCAKLVIGDVDETLRSFAPPYPVAFVAFDLDYYSSTKSALRVFGVDHLPRVYCYFDDTIWPEVACHNEYIGELCAIREFNSENLERKLCPIHGLGHTRPRKAAWNEGIYVFHDFRHAHYCANLTPETHGELPLEPR